MWGEGEDSSEISPTRVLLLAAVASIQIIIFRTVALVLHTITDAARSLSAPDAGGAAAWLFMPVVLFERKDNRAAELAGRVDEQALQPLLNSEAHQVLPGDGAHHLQQQESQLFGEDGAHHLQHRTNRLRNIWGGGAHHLQQQRQVVF